MVISLIRAGKVNKRWLAECRRPTANSQLPIWPSASFLAWMWLTGVWLKGSNLWNSGMPETRRRWGRTTTPSGADELIFLDITASGEERQIMIEAVKRTAEQVFIPLTVGGGIRTLDDIRAMLKAGADKTAVNTAAVLQPEIIDEGARRFGSQCMVVAIDARQSGPGRWEVLTHGGRRRAAAADGTGLDAVAWAKEAEERGAGEILLTSHDRDGTRDGYDLDLTRAVSEAVRIPVIASGGAGTLQHLYEGLTAGAADAVLAASIFHYQEYTISQAKVFLAERGVPVDYESRAVVDDARADRTDLQLAEIWERWPDSGRRSGRNRRNGPDGCLYEPEIPGTFPANRQDLVL